MKISPGKAYPYGITKTTNGSNFSVYSDIAKAVFVVLADKKTHATVHRIPMKRNGDIWHITVEEFNPDEFLYGFEVDGVLVSDPYARSLASGNVWGKEEKELPKLAHFVFDVPFDWQNVDHPKIPMEDLVIYEMHVRAFTQDSSSQVSNKGTYLGIIEKIPHLKQMGINAVELLPVFEFNECELHRKNPKTGERLYNFWGYSTLNFFTPMHKFATNEEKETAILEFKTMVRELHKAGIEVILDVVYNHTAENGKIGPVFNFKQLSPKTYYHFDKEGKFENYSGCGNAMNCNQHVTAKLIVDSLHYWVEEMKVDGFRFDLASILTRDEDGDPVPKPYVVKAISQDPHLSNTKLIAEAWDAAGLYQVGGFPHFGKWAEWNGKYRDRVRKFIKGTDDCSGDFSRALSGSEDLYGHGRKPYHSINFITAHDGFTLCDLVTYQQKHNEANGEKNQDGGNDNENWNCGVEGPTQDHDINLLRLRQMKNYLLALSVSVGTPMFLMGDEYQHSRLGNNNTYCQDNALNWFLWNELASKNEFFHFYCSLIDFRKNHQVFRRKTFLTSKDVAWHGLKPFEPNWSKENRFVSYVLHCSKGNDLYIAFNANHTDVDVVLPPPSSGKNWHIFIDTAKATSDSGPIKTKHMQSHTAFIAECK